MNAEQHIPPPLPAMKRSRFVTVLAWVMMIIGVLGLPISFISALMIVAHSYGTEHSDPIGFVIVVLGPAMLAITGIGLLRRKRMALLCTMLILVVTLVINGWSFVRGPRPTTATTSASGVQTTVMGSEHDPLALPFIALCGALLFKLRSQGVQEEFPRQMLPNLPAIPPNFSPSSFAQENHPTWRVGHRGRDMMYYEEQVKGRWHRIDIDGEMLMGRAHHVIYFKTMEEWKSYPEWARERRADIIARIKSEFRAPDYEYMNDA